MKRKPPRCKLDPREPFWSWWTSLTPAERLERSWRMRTQIKNPKKVQDAKLWPKP